MPSNVLESPTRSARTTMRPQRTALGWVGVLCLWAVGLIFPAPAWGTDFNPFLPIPFAQREAFTPGTQAPKLYAKRPEDPEERNVFKLFSREKNRPKFPPQYQEWQSLPPQEKDVMRRRMEEYRSLPPQQQELYRQRWQQWQQIPPEDRRRVESDLQRWKELSPEQREAIRRLFNR